MKLHFIRVFAALPGLVLLIDAVGFVTMPRQTAASLGMPLLDGIGLSTQLGDFTAFFTAGAGFVLYGAWRMSPALLQAAGWLLALAAIGRIIAWGAHGAPLAIQLITIECLIALWLFGSGYMLRRAQ